MKQSNNDVEVTTQGEESVNKKTNQQQPINQDNLENEGDNQKQKSWLELLLEKMLGKGYEEQVSYNPETGQYSFTMKGGPNKFADIIAGLNQMFEEDTKEMQESEKYFDNLFQGIDDARKEGTWPSISDIAKNPDSLRDKMAEITQRAREGVDKTTQKSDGKDVEENNQGVKPDNHFVKMLEERASNGADRGIIS